MQFTINYNERILHGAVNTFFKRRLVQGMGWSGLLAFGLCAGILIYLVLRGDRSWLAGVIGAVLLLFVTGFFALWLVHHHNMRAKLKAIPSRQARVSLDDRIITFSAESGVTTLPWTGFTEVWKLPDCWLLFLAENNFVTVPLKDVPQEALDFIERHLPVTCKRL